MHRHRPNAESQTWHPRSCMTSGRTIGYTHRYSSDRSRGEASGPISNLPNLGRTVAHLIPDPMDNASTVYRYRICEEVIFFFDRPGRARGATSSTLAGACRTRATALRYPQCVVMLCVFERAPFGEAGSVHLDLSAKTPNGGYRVFGVRYRRFYPRTRVGRCVRRRARHYPPRSSMVVGLHVAVVAACDLRPIDLLVATHPLRQ